MGLYFINVLDPMLEIDFVVGTKTQVGLLNIKAYLFLVIVTSNKEIRCNHCIPYDSLSSYHIQIGIGSPKLHLFGRQFCVGLLQTFCSGQKDWAQFPNFDPCTMCGKTLLVSGGVYLLGYNIYISSSYSPANN